MKTLIVPDVPGRTLMRLRLRARESRRSVSEEVIGILRRQLRRASATSKQALRTPVITKR